MGGKVITEIQAESWINKSKKKVGRKIPKWLGGLISSGSFIVVLYYTFLFRIITLLFPFFLVLLYTCVCTLNRLIKREREWLYKREKENATTHQTTTTTTTNRWNNFPCGCRPAGINCRAFDPLLLRDLFNSFERGAATSSSFLCSYNSFHFPIRKREPKKGFLLC
jgi:hypothetical protein